MIYGIAENPRPTGRCVKWAPASQGITLRPCLVHLHIWASNFSILECKFFYTCLSAKVTNKFESNNIKFHKSLGYM